MINLRYFLEIKLGLAKFRLKKIINQITQGNGFKAENISCQKKHEFYELILSYHVVLFQFLMKLLFVDKLISTTPLPLKGIPESV